jgi:hypothetical protein
MNYYSFKFTCTVNSEREYRTISQTFFSPLNKHFVELDEPLSTDVTMKVVMNSEAAIILDFDDVPIDAMDLIDARFQELLRAIAEQGADFFDMKRIRTISESAIPLFFLLSEKPILRLLNLQLQCQRCSM